MKLIFTLTLVSFLFMLACTPAAINKSPSISLENLAQWPQIYQENFNQITHLTSKARMTIESVQMSQSFTAGFIFAAPDTLFIKAEGPFGLDLGEIFIGKNRFIIYNQFNNQFFAGPLNDPFYTRFLQSHISLNEVKNALVGFVPLPDNLKLVNASRGVFSAVVKGDRWRIVVNPKTALLESWEIYREDKAIFRQEFKKYKKIKNAVFPTLIRLILPERKEMFSVFHKNIVLNEKMDSSTYRIYVNSKVEQLTIEE